MVRMVRKPRPKFGVQPESIPIVAGDKVRLRSTWFVGEVLFVCADGDLRVRWNHGVISTHSRKSLILV